MNINLVNMRKKIGLTQEEIANKVGLSRSYYGLIENGNRRPSPQVAKRIAEVLGFAEWYRLLEPIEDSA